MSRPHGEAHTDRPYPNEPPDCERLQLNASDDRGIDIVRNQILNFAGTKSIFKQGFKLIILDEADAMTQDAQNALRRSEPRNSVSQLDFSV